MTAWEYDLDEFKLVEKWSSKKRAEKLHELRSELNAKGEEGWELLGLHSFELVGGITGSAKGTVTLMVWKRELEADAALRGEPRAELTPPDSRDPAWQPDPTGRHEQR